MDLLGFNRKDRGVNVMFQNTTKQHQRGIFTKQEIIDRLAYVGLPFDEVESGCGGVICLLIATDDEEYSDE